MSTENGFLENVFKLEENNTNVKTEVIAGFTTFYDHGLYYLCNPSILSDAGMPFEGVLIATIMSAVLGTLAMAFFN